MGPAADPASIMLVGCYTTDNGGSGTGVTALARSADGWEPVGDCALASPTWLSGHPLLPVGYAAGEIADGVVSALRVGPAGDLAALGSQASRGAELSRSPLPPGTGPRPRRIAETEVGPGCPRHFCLLDDELLVALQLGDRVRRFGLDPSSGTLADRGGWATDSPACLLPVSGPRPGHPG